MKSRKWFSRVCELESEGRFDEARRLFEENTTTIERKRFYAATQALGESLAKIPPEAIAEAEEIMKRFRSLKDLPEDHWKRKIWEPFWRTTPRYMASIWRRLPDPTANPGRPKNSRKITDEMLAEMDERCVPGVRPTTAAKALLGSITSGGTLKSQADNLVKAWKKSRGIK